MKGLLYKEVISARQALTTALLLCVFFAVAACLGGDMMLGASVGGIVALSFTMPIASLQIDKSTGWDKFICSSPIPRSRTILAKYILVPVSTALFLCIGLISDLAAGMSVPLISFLFYLSVILILDSISIPVCIRWGNSMLVPVFLLVFGVPLALNKLGAFGASADRILDFLLGGTGAGPLLALGAFGLALILMTGSYFLTCKLYKAMEF